jgi:RNA recognition motif-containing protein
MNMYVSNVSFHTTEDDLKTLFGKFGAVKSAKLVLDAFTQKSRGFAFVEMPSDAEANEAIAALNNKEIQGRPLFVAQARPKEARKTTFVDKSGNRKW